MTSRKMTKQIKIGSVPVGGGSPVVVQSMTNTDTRDVKATLNQIGQLAKAGCEIVRLAVPDMDAAHALKQIKAGADLPLVADIHFDYRLAMAALESGVDGLRLNPGNIRDAGHIRQIASKALLLEVPIRVGVNSGSVPEDILKKYGRATPEALVESALRETAILEDAGFEMIKVSLKSSNVLDTVAAYRLMSEKSDYPLHLGVTEAGTHVAGTVKSSLGIGMLLAEGIGDTLRVSLTSDPVDEIPVAYEILRALDIRHRGPEIISCPTCGRCEIDLFGLVKQVEEKLGDIEEPIKVAVMGCVVNGPGEARSAQIGVAGGRGQGILFKDGKQIAKVPENELADLLIKEIYAIIGKNK